MFTREGGGPRDKRADATLVLPKISKRRNHTIDPIYNCINRSQGHRNYHLNLFLPLPPVDFS